MRGKFQDEKCPFCAEEIQDDAIKCRFCGEFLQHREDADEAPSESELTEHWRKFGDTFKALPPAGKWRSWNSLTETQKIFVVDNLGINPPEKVFDRRKLVWPILIGFGIFVVYLSPDDTKSTDTVEYKMAVLNKGSHVDRRDPTVTEFKLILDHLDRERPEPRDRIADMIHKTQSLLKEEKGIQLSLLRVARDLKAAVPPGTDKAVAFAEIASTYVVLVGQGKE